MSYSWYVASNDTGTSGAYYPGDLIIVGEVQNVGAQTLHRITIQGTVYSTDGSAVASSYSPVFKEYLLPQEKAPFYIEVPPEYSYTGDLSWIPNIKNVTFQTIAANITDSFPYPDLRITSNSSYVDSNSVYTIVGSITNTGNQDTGRPWMEATFYNSSGTVIAVGVSSYLTQTSSPLTPNQAVQFTLTPRDSTPALTAQISSYSILVQTENPIIPEFPSAAVLAVALITATFATAFFAKQRMRKHL